MGPLSPQLFAILSGLVEEHVGIHYGHSDVEMFADKVFSRMADAGFESALDYYYYLRYDPRGPAEIDALVEALVVGETYLFREVDGLFAAVEHVLRPAIEARGRARVWSAACSTGEEPVTLAMVLADAALLDACEIVATDVSVRAISRAREGVYGPRALRALSPLRDEPLDPRVKRLSDRWLVREGTSARANRRLLDKLKLQRLNLLDAPAVAALGQFDLVLCRNVLIYFADDTVRKVVLRLCDAMRDDGRLLLGASESLLRFGTLLRCEERGGAFFYAKDPKEGK